MHGRQYKELWEIRFLNILNLEKESNLFYTRLLRRNKFILESTNMKAVLDQIMKDRVKRTRIASKLVRIARQKMVSESSEGV